jgi:hypothetical protein
MSSRKILLAYSMLAIAAPAASAAVVDGSVADGEYGRSASFADGAFVLHWQLSGAEIAVAVVGKTSGYVALGWSPTSVMKDADMVVGWVDEAGTAHVVDSWGVGEHGHKPDVDIGGTSDLAESAGREAGGVTTIEFRRKRSTADRYDKALDGEGELTLLWALGSSDDMRRHASRGVERLRLGEGTSSAATPAGPATAAGNLWHLWPLHAGLMSFGVACMCGALAVGFYRTKKWWMTVHLVLGLLAGVSIIAGFVTAKIIFGGGSGGVHNAVGGIAAILSILGALAGTSLKVLKARGRKMWPGHRWGSRAILVLLLVAVVTGVLAASVPS